MHSRHELELDLQAAIGTDQFFLCYQPIFNLSDMSVIGVEALLRWNHPAKGLLQPDEFIPALEASGLIIPVGRWVINEACRQAMLWRDMGQTVKMSVNARHGNSTRTRCSMTCAVPSRSRDYPQSR